jgi:hypothetical protein
MRAFTQDSRTEAILTHVRGGDGNALMDDTPPRQSRLLRHLTDDQPRTEDRTW